VFEVRPAVGQETSKRQLGSMNRAFHPNDPRARVYAQPQPAQPQRQPQWQPPAPRQQRQQPQWQQPGTWVQPTEESLYIGRVFEQRRRDDQVQALWDLLRLAREGPKSV
jgi:hypothetical protein